MSRFVWVCFRCAKSLDVSFLSNFRAGELKHSESLSAKSTYFLFISCLKVEALFELGADLSFIRSSVWFTFKSLNSNPFEILFSLVDVCFFYFSLDFIFYNDRNLGDIRFVSIIFISIV